MPIRRPGSRIELNILHFRQVGQPLHHSDSIARTNSTTERRKLTGLRRRMIPDDENQGTV